MLRRILVFFLAVLCGSDLLAQSTKVRGVVLDAKTGETIPFAGVYFKGTTIGQSADIDGKFSIETRSPEAKVLVCQLLGYEVAEVEVRQGTFSTIDFKLVPIENVLSGAVVKADNKRVRAMLRAIEANRWRNDPERKPGYEVELYNKMELDLTHPREQLKGKRFLKEFGFAFDYMDTSVVSGVPYLPIMISETVAKRMHTSSPTTDRETILANRISGVNQDNNLVSQFTGNFHLRANFYKDFINAFGIEFPSPLQSSGLLYYNYYIIDSTKFDGRKTYLVRYHPKQLIASPAFDGEMYIDTEDWALKSIKAKMVRGGNVNWVRDLLYEIDYRRINDSTWFYKSDRMYADFSLALKDSSNLMSFIGNRTVEYRDPSFENVERLDAAAAPVKVLPEANYKDDAYWENQRPYELSQKEKDIYTMVERIKDQPLYKDIYTVIYTIVTGYWDIGKIGIGPYINLLSYNNLEGARLQFGMHTSKDFSQKWRLSGYLAYGIHDKAFKGGLTYERMFSREPTSKLTLDAHYDVNQLGKGNSKITQGNILSSAWGDYLRLSPGTSFSAVYDHEFSQGFNAQAEINLKRQYSNAFVPLVAWDGTQLGSVASNEIHLQARFSSDETVNRGYFIKTYVHTYRPVVTLDLTGSIGGLRPGDVSFLRPEISFQYRLKIPPLGISLIKANAGTILGRVPYPYLHFFPGNVTGLIDRSAFSCMEYMEFAADSWAHIMWDHNFNGFFLGKIPLLRRLQLREVVTLKAAWGNLRDRNNGLDASFGAPAVFPEGVNLMTGPYVEVGAGITNIFRLFRVQGYWRLTDRTLPDGTPCRRPFVINVGIDVRF